MDGPLGNSITNPISIDTQKKTYLSKFLFIVPETPRDSAVENRPPNSAPLPAKFASSSGFSGK